MDAPSWTAPPGAAQPMGIQSTAGAIPIVNEKGEVSMKKVKVQRYVSGKRPDYAPDSSEDELSDEEDFTKPRGTAPLSPVHKSLTEAEKLDPRLRRLLAVGPEQTNASAVKEEEEDKPEENGGITVRPRIIHQAEVVEMSDGEDEDTDKKAPRQRTEVPKSMSASHTLNNSDNESDGEIDEEALALRRLKLREKALQRDEEELLGKEEEGSEESSEEESSEYSEETDSEEEGPRLKPVFVRKKDRVTIHQQELQQAKLKQLETDKRRRVEERKRETLRIIESDIRQATRATEEGGTLNGLDGINTDDEADDAEYEAWKLRELKRLKRDKDEREAAEKDKEEVDKLHSMTEEERRIELRNNPRQVTNKAVKGKYKFLQKYFHRGSFFLHSEEDVYKRDFSGATLEDHFDKTILPKVMQVKNFGRSGRTKYTHLVDQDTTSFDSPWAMDSQMNLKFYNTAAGGIKSMDHPSLKKNAPPPPQNNQQQTFQGRK